MSTKTTIHINGVTGYIGGTVLARLLEHPKATSFHITALIRDPVKAEKLKSFGVEPIVGSLDDVEVIKKAASEADIVIATADCDHQPSCHAILRGLKKRFEATGKRSAFINTSGTGALSDNAQGMFASDVIYDDASPAQLEALPLTNMHRAVDTAIIAADAAGYLSSYLVLPSTIWGWADHALVRAGIANHRSLQMPIVISASLLRGRPGVWGKGASVWPCVEIGELGELYVRLLDAVLEGPSKVPHGREGYFFGAADEFTWYEASRVVGEAMVKVGKAKDAEPTPFTKEEIEKYLSGYDLSSNARCKATHSYALGWQPKKMKADFLASLHREVEGCIETPFPLKSRVL